jgi:hypothetical protein
MGVTTSRGAVGTPAYMAPEQARDTHQASAASDVYALGATLLFAATGHPPYQGGTVMDVLARLATEEPDLAGLPGELTELIAACLQRVPRDRPTSSAMLAQLGQFTETRAGTAGEHSYLSDTAMALVVQYQRNPLLAGQPGQSAQQDSGGDSTSASFTELPASYLTKKSPRRRARAASRPGWRGWIRTHLAWAGWVSVGAALVVAGVILGASLTSSAGPGPGSGLPVPPAPQTVCGAADVASHQLCMNQSQGDPGTAFLVEGQGFPPGTPLVVTLSEEGPPPDNKPLLSVTSTVKPVAAANGKFKVLVSELYSGSLQLGLFTVQVTAPDGHQAQTQFMVLPPGAAPAPSGP